MRPHQSCDSFSEAGVGRSQEQPAKAARRRACMWGGRPTWLYLAADGSQPTTRPLGPPAPPTASPHTAGSHHSPSRVPQGLATSLCSSLHLPHLPPTSPCPQASEKHTGSPENSLVQHPTTGSRSSLPSHLHRSHALVPCSCGLLICPWNSHSPGPCVCLALGTLGMPRCVPGSISDDERFLLLPLHHLLHSVSQVLRSPSPSPSV